MSPSENALTGDGVGAAISGVRTVITHQRVDFLYYRWIKSLIVQLVEICLEEN